MFKSKKFFLLILCCMIFLCSNYAFGFSFIKKKEKKKKLPPMVQTVEEWKETATSLKIDARKRPEDISSKDEKWLPVEEKPSYIEAYNVQAGSRELNLGQLFKGDNVRSPFIVDPKFKNAVYSEVYFFPQTKQAASSVYLFELDSSLDKKKKVVDASIFEHTRYSLMSTALPALREGFYSTLTVVDFSSDGKKVLVKEKRGSNKFGNYETYIWVFFITDEKAENNLCFRNNRDFNNERSPIYGFKDENLKKGAGSGFSFDMKNSNNIGGFNKEGNRLNTSSNDNKNLSGTGLGDLPDNINLKPLNDNSKAIKLTPVSSLNKADANLADVIKGDVVGKGYMGERWYNKPSNKSDYNYFEDSKKQIGFPVRLNLLNEAIKAYWFDKQNLILNLIRWDIKPLGFRQGNDNEVIVQAMAWTKSKKQVSLGNWAVNLTDGTARILKDNEAFSIAANGFIVVQKLNPR